MSVSTYIKNSGLQIVAFKHDVMKLFNIVIGNSKASSYFWQAEIRNSLQEKYVTCLTAEEMHIDFDLKSLIDFRVLFVYLCALTGVKLKGSAMRQLMSSTQNFKFVESDIKSLDARVQSGFLVLL